MDLGRYMTKKIFESACALTPAQKERDLVPTDKVGIRPQLAIQTSRALEIDYVMAQGGRPVHVRDANTPTFSSSFAFADLFLMRPNCA